MNSVGRHLHWRDSAPWKCKHCGYRQTRGLFLSSEEEYRLCRTDQRHEWEPDLDTWQKKHEAWQRRHRGGGGDGLVIVGAVLFGLFVSLPFLILFLYVFGSLAIKVIGWAIA